MITLFKIIVLLLAVVVAVSVSCSVIEWLVDKVLGG